MCKYYPILYQWLEHLYILVSEGSPGASPPRILRDNETTVLPSWGLRYAYLAVSLIFFLICSCLSPLEKWYYFWNHISYIGISVWTVQKKDGRGLEVVAFICSSSEVKRWTSPARVRCFFTMASSLSWNLGNG